MQKACSTLSLILIAAVVSTASGALASLPPPVQSVLDKHKVPARAVSVVVRDLGSDTDLLRYRADTPRNPASVMKLVTTLAALEILGPGYVWPTEAYASGTIRNGRLAGDLIIKGYGDPYLVTERFWQFTRGLRDRGLTDIDGDLVLDNSRFEASAAGAGDFDGRPDRAYNALPAALSLNFQATRFQIVADGHANRVRVIADPPLADLTVDNQLRLVDDRCSWEHYYPNVAIVPVERGGRIRFSGDFSARCEEGSVNRIVASAPQHVFGAFKQLWGEMGGSLAGSLRTAPTPPGAIRLHRIESPPLSEVVRGMNKFSNNLMSRMLLLTVGAERFGAPGTVANGRAAVEEWLARSGIEAKELVLDNGAGLSRSARVSADTLDRLLRRAYSGHVMPEFVASLAISGVDGTLWRRFGRSPLAGRAHLKTGSLNDVSGVGGYVLAQSGRRYSVVLLVNHREAHRGSGKAIQDALLEWVYQH